MRHLVRRLERELVAERTELAVLPPVNDLLSRWEEALCQNRAHSRHTQLRTPFHKAGILSHDRSAEL